MNTLEIIPMDKERLGKKWKHRKQIYKDMASL